MNFNANVKQFYTSPEILATEKNLVAFTVTVSDSSISGNAEGKKVVPRGSLLASDGTIKNDGTVIGILANDVDVTTGPQPGSLIVEGYILKDRLPVKPAQPAIDALKKITFR